MLNRLVAMYHILCIKIARWRLTNAMKKEGLIADDGKEHCPWVMQVSQMPWGGQSIFMGRDIDWVQKQFNKHIQTKN